MLAIQGELESAVTHLQKALDLNPAERVRISIRNSAGHNVQLNPSNWDLPSSLQAIQVELQKAQKKKGKVEKEEREMYRRMVEGTQEKTKSGSEDKKSPSRLDRWVSGGMSGSINVSYNSHFNFSRDHYPI